MFEISKLSGTQGGIPLSEEKGRGNGRGICNGGTGREERGGCEGDVK